MKQAIVRNSALIGGLGLSAAACVLAVPYLTSPRGAVGPTVLQAQSPLAAILAVVVCVSLATIVAGIVARIINPVVGMFVLGAGIFVLAGRLETIAEIAFAGTSGDSRVRLALLALETCLWSIVALGATIIVFRIGGPLQDVREHAEGRKPHPLISADAFKSAAAGVLIIAAVLLIAQSPMKGQMIGATFLGGMLAGLIGRLISPNVQPVLIFASPILFGAIGHTIGMAMLKQPLDVAYVMDKLPLLSRPMPIDYAAGSLMGVAMGVGWARSFLHHEEIVGQGVRSGAVAIPPSAQIPASDRDDLEKLLNFLLPLAKKHLNSFGEFYPFAAATEVNGKIAAIAAYTGAEHPTSHDVRNTLVKILQDQAKSGKIIATGLAENMSVVIPGKVTKSDAVLVTLERTSGKSVRVYAPYRKTQDGYQFDELFATAADPVIFQIGR